MTAEADDGRLIDDDPKSQARRRRVAFPREIAHELRWHLERFAQPGKDGLVFIGPSRPAKPRGRESGHGSSIGHATGTRPETRLEKIV